MKKLLLSVLFSILLSNAVFAAQALPVTGVWEYAPKEGKGFGTPEGYRFKINETGEYLTGSQAVGQDYYINESGTNLYHKYVFHGNKCFFSGKTKYPDGHFEMFSKGVGLGGVTFAPGYVEYTWMGLTDTQWSESKPDTTNAYIASWTLEELPADAIYITLSNSIGDGPLTLCKYRNTSPNRSGSTSSGSIGSMEVGPGIGLK